MIFNKRLTSAAHELSVVQRIYENAFPVDERRDFDVLLALIEGEPLFTVEAIVRGSEVCGFMSWWNMDGWRYIEHFAIDETCRGSGIGRRALHQFLSRTDNVPVVIEVEPPVDDTTRRRITFYQSMGFTLHDDYRYIQPPYAVGRMSVELNLMTWGMGLSPDCDIITRTLHRVVYGVKDGTYSFREFENSSLFPASPK
ncbi:MAG: GNAT family N-acetyltransferase [Bacteroidaceae bacterium]|nr:GNAT family N-acetyltransferase [Bacteroidaceae bacterium]